MQFSAIFALSVFFCDLSNSVAPTVAPTLRGATGGFVTPVQAQKRKNVFLQPLALPKAGHGLCDRREMILSTKVGLHVLRENAFFPATVDGPQGHLDRCWVTIW